MRFGTYYFLQAPPGASYPEVIHREFAQILLTEALGFDSVWLTEHHFIEYGISTSPMALAAAIAARTERVGIGLAAVILPFHDPIRLAEDIAFVDILSKGRLRVGVGRGNRPIEFTGYRVPQIENRRRFAETLDVMLQAWTCERVSYRGEFFTLDDIPVIPKPYQKPHPPVSLVCISPETIRLAAGRGWAMLNSILFGPFSQIEANRDIYVAALRAAGRSEADVATLLRPWGVSRHVYVAPTDAQALRETRDAELWYQRSLARFLVPERIEAAHPSLQPQFRAMADRLASITWERLVEETVIFGSPERVTDRIREMEAAGVGEVLCWMNFGGLPPDRVERSMRLFAEKVMPQFR